MESVAAQFPHARFIKVPGCGHSVYFERAEFPHARFIKVPGCGHSVYFERADEFNRIVGGFLREHAPQPS